MRQINGEWHMGVDEGRGDSIHVYGHVCAKCGQFIEVNPGPYKDGESVVAEHECRALDQREGGRDDN